MRRSNLLVLLLWVIVVCAVVIDLWALWIFAMQIGKTALRFMAFPYHALYLHFERRVTFILAQSGFLVATYFLFWKEKRPAFFAVAGLIVFDTLVMLSPAVGNL